MIPGGRHTGKLTSNALVVLSDGAYLELIAFDHPVEHYPPGSEEREKIEQDPWARLPPGWIDWAHLGLNEHIGEIINRAAGNEGPDAARYREPHGGGRTRPDGRVLKWIITFPDLKHPRGNLPFFCQDVTPREWRVRSFSGSSFALWT